MPYGNEVKALGFSERNVCQGLTEGVINDVFINGINNADLMTGKQLNIKISLNRKPNQKVFNL